MILTLDEGDRQAVLMALAHLAVERPGWDDALSRIASRIDNLAPLADGQFAPVGPEMYSTFKRLRRAALEK